MLNIDAIHAWFEYGVSVDLPCQILPTHRMTNTRARLQLAVFSRWAPDQCRSRVSATFIHSPESPWPCDLNQCRIGVPWLKAKPAYQSAPRWHTYIIVTWSEFANTRDWIPLICYVNLMLMIVVNVHVVDFVDTWRLCDGKVCCVLYVRPVHAQLVGGPQSGVFSRAPLRPY